MSAKYYQVLFWLSCFSAFMLFFIDHHQVEAATIPYLDKLGHFFVFSILTWLLLNSYRLKTSIIILLLSIYGVSIEAIQYFLPYRHASLADWVADFLGVITILFAYPYLPSLLKTK